MFIIGVIAVISLIIIGAFAINWSGNSQERKAKLYANVTVLGVVGLVVLVMSYYFEDIKTLL